jgi:hypothetical protein
VPSHPPASLHGMDGTVTVEHAGRGPAQPAPSSLVPSHQSVPPKEAPRECLNGPPDMRLYCVETAEVKRVPCRRLTCAVCLRKAAWRRSLAIKHSRPERYITLTLAGDDWQTVRGRVKRFRYDIVRELGQVEWVWNVERNPKGTGHHVQAWQRGDFLSQAELSRMATRQGFGKRVWIERWKSGGESYALKEAYAVKDAAGAADPPDARLLRDAGEGCRVGGHPARART